MLRHIADHAFERGASYSEQEVNDRLRRWCEGSREIDHVALRRYLVDLNLLVRDNDNCTYWLAAED